MPRRGISSGPLVTTPPNIGPPPSAVRVGGPPVRNVTVPGVSAPGSVPPPPTRDQKRVSRVEARNPTNIMGTTGSSPTTKRALRRRANRASRK